MRNLLLSTCLILCAGQFASGDDWVDEVQIGPFVCRSEFSLKGHSGLLQQLSRLPREVEQTLHITATKDSEPQNPIQVNLFASKQSFHRHLSARMPGRINRRALFIKGPDMGRVYVYRNSSFDTDVRHECTHALLHNALPYVPQWLDEGLAEYFEVPAQQRAGQHPHLRSLRWPLLLTWRPDLEELETKRDLQDMDGGDYRDSWAWVHFMLHGPPEARETLTDYLQAIQDDDPPGRFSEYLKRRIPDADRRLMEHMRAWKN